MADGKRVGWVARLAISVEEELQQDAQEPATVSDQVRNKRHLLVSIAMFHLSPSVMCSIQFNTFLLLLT
jgi:hypothetical protein